MAIFRSVHNRNQLCNCIICQSGMHKLGGVWPMVGEIFTCTPSPTNKHEIKHPGIVNQFAASATAYSGWSDRMTTRDNEVKVRSRRKNDTRKSSKSKKCSSELFLQFSSNRLSIIRLIDCFYVSTTINACTFYNLRKNVRAWVCVWVGGWLGVNRKHA